jgi:hypothetical protein
MKRKPVKGGGGPSFFFLLHFFCTFFAATKFFWVTSRWLFWRLQNCPWPRVWYDRYSASMLTEIQTSQNVGKPSKWPIKYENPLNVLRVLHTDGRTDGYGDSNIMVGIFCNFLFWSAKYLPMRKSHATPRLEFEKKFISEQTSLKYKNENGCWETYFQAYSVLKCLRNMSSVWIY